jgi:hypothetical protein
VKLGPYSLLWVTCVALLIMLVPGQTSATDKVDFSGKYVPESRKNTSDNDATLEVIQSDESIDITRVALGKRTISHCPLNGSDGDYTSSGGVPGKCKAQLKSKYVTIESVVLSRPQQASSTTLRMRTREKWQLSADAKTLTIKSAVDFPDLSSDISAAVASIASGTMKYKRTSP